MKKLLEKLFEHKSLNRVEAQLLFTSITEGTANEAQIVAAISALKMRTITVDELNGFRQVLLDKVVPVNLNADNAIDVCGTGGDGKNTFNISTLAAIVIAGAGYDVIKHGNYGVSSLVGSSTILENYGYQFTTDEENLANQLSESNLCFLHAPLFHPALKQVGPIRKNLGVRTFFNFLGPLVNPVQPAYQLTGVYNLQLMRMYKQILAEERSGFKVVHSLDGFDEVSLTGPFKVAASSEELILYPEDLDLKTIQLTDLHGGTTVEESLHIFTQILTGKGTDEQNSAVLVNAALGIQCFDSNKNFREAYEEARYALQSGQAKHKLDKAVEISKHVKIQS
ncbi:MAG: anthranilate phosphoribosyltransferase [Crocinitomicaceae bacterium]|nr:anthranilate phosphoribosyltransferase [Crocinitomicaceae bacterium]